jgi:uncharacterized protein (DUF983 family)
MEAQGVSLKHSKERFSSDLLLFLLGVVLVYCALFGTGYVLYSQWLGAIVLITLALVCAVAMVKIFKGRSL